MKRLAKGYQAGLTALISKKRGRASRGRLNEATRTTAVELIAAHYGDFAPTLANEKLAELHGIRMSVESARQMMITAGYWHTKKGGTACTYPMRERRPRFGEMIQIDGSPHDWFEGRSASCSLLAFIDDATVKGPPPDTRPAGGLGAATRSTRPGLRGAKVTVHEHFDGRCELFWQRRKLSYSAMDKPLRQAPAADGKAVNVRADTAVMRRSTGHQPAADHPWRNMPVGKSPNDGQCATW